MMQESFCELKAFCRDVIGTVAAFYTLLRSK